MYLQTIGPKPSEDLRFAIIDCLESARSAEGTGGSYRLYLKRAVEDVSKPLTPAQAMTVLQNGTRWPNAAAAAFYKLPAQLDQPTVDRVIALDKSLQESTEDGVQQLRLGVIANCHQLGAIGQNVGPDLTSLAQRFSNREILESAVDNRFDCRWQTIMAIHPSSRGE